MPHHQKEKGEWRRREWSRQCSYGMRENKEICCEITRERVAGVWAVCGWEVPPVLAGCGSLPLVALCSLGGDKWLRAPHPWPAEPSRSVGRWVLCPASPSEVSQGCGNTPENSACPTKWPHFRAFPPISILSYVFQNCPRLYMPWRKINFQCNTHREIHVQNMFFLCQKKNNKWLGRRENTFPD